MQAQEKYGFIYLWHDIKKDMFYVGSHWGHENDGYICSSKWMRDAFRYRPQDFRRKIVKRLYECTRQELYVEEQRWLSMIKPHELKRKYYNLSLSVKDPWYQYEEKRLSIGQKISQAKKGKSTGPCSPEKAKAISEAKKAAFASGKTVITEEWRRKNSEARKGKDTWMKGKQHSEESRRKMSESRKGYVPSEESKRKNGESHRGMKRSAETKKKMSLAISKSYIITRGGETFEVNGLKSYATQQNIPYTTLHKAMINRTPIPKYDIQIIKPK